MRSGASQLQERRFRLEQSCPSDGASLSVPADARIQAAREPIKRDANAADRQEIVATMMEQCLKIATEASETRQLSNAIGAMRLYGELIGVSGNNRN